MAIAEKTRMDWLKKRAPVQRAKATLGKQDTRSRDPWMMRNIEDPRARATAIPDRFRPPPPRPGPYEEVKRRTGYEEGFPGLERIPARSTVTERRQLSASALDQPTAADLARMPEGGMPDWLRALGDTGSISPEQTPQWLRDILMPGDWQGAPGAFLPSAVEFPADFPVQPPPEPLSTVEQIYADMGVSPDAKRERVPLFPMWEEKIADLMRSQPSTVGDEDWYDGDGGQDWWGGWGGYGGGGGGVSPQKAARWWLNLTRWNI